MSTLLSRKLILCALVAAACNGPLTDGADEDAPLFSLGAADSARSAGIDHYQVVSRTSTLLKIYAVTATGARVATYTGTRVTGGTRAEIAPGTTFTRTTRPLVHTVTFQRNGSLVTVHRSLSDGLRTVALAETVDAQTRTWVGALWRAGTRTFTVGATTTATQVESFLWQAGVADLFTAPLTKVLETMAFDPGLLQPSPSVSEVSWWACAKCAYRFARNSWRNGIRSALLSAGLDPDCAECAASVGAGFSTRSS